MCQVPNNIFRFRYDESMLDKSIEITNIFYNGLDIDSDNILFVNYEGDIENMFRLTKNNEEQRYEIVNIEQSNL